MKKEERHKFVVVFPSWLERFIPHILNQTWVFSNRFANKTKEEGYTSLWCIALSLPFSVCINDFTNVETEIELPYGKTFKRRLKIIYNLRITYKFKEIFIFDDDASGAFRHIKLHPTIAGSRAFIIGNTPYVLIAIFFSSNVSTRNWEVVALSRTRLAEWL